MIWMMEKNQARVILWSAPRTLSTAFTRAISNKPCTKVIVENLYFAYYMGSERVSSKFDGIRDERPGCTFADMRKQLEQEFSEYDTVFSKQMAYHMIGRMAPDQLSQGYLHTFIIRNPRDSIYSLYKFTQKYKEWQPLNPNQVGVKELYDMFTLVTDTMKQKPIVVDVEDLLMNPEGTLKSYCAETGIQFHPNMLQWSSEPQDLVEFTNEALDPIFYEHALTSTCFKHYVRSVVPELPDYLEKLINECMPYYERMSQHCLKPLS